MARAAQNGVAVVEHGRRTALAPREAKDRHGVVSDAPSSVRPTLILLIR
jgi:hypothetical protein